MIRPTRLQQRDHRILRQRADWISLLHIGAAIAANWAALTRSLYWEPLALILGMHLIAVAHNHLHAPIFRYEILNSMLDPVLFILTGIPQVSWRVHHLGNHHRHIWTAQDWSSAFNFRDAEAPYKPVGYRYYQLTYLPLFYFYSIHHILISRNRRLLWLLVRDISCFSIAHLTLAVIYGPIYCAIVFIPVYVGAALMLGAANYIEHYNSYDGHGDFHAWTFTCRLHNLLTYNSGYHLLHHLRPGLHWSELAKVHEADFSYCPSRLIESGLFPGYRSDRGFNEWLKSNATHENAHGNVESPA